MIESGFWLKAKRQEIGLSQAKLAKLACVPQHLLSAFELDKSSLNTNYIGSIEEILETISETKITELKKKRYQSHSFNGIAKDTTRASQIRQTEANKDYLELLKQLEKDRYTQSKKGKVLSFFSGCGGFSLGFNWANFNILGFLELKKEFRQIYHQNFPNAVELGSDIQKITPQDIIEWNNKFGDIDVIIGGPPCQGFSLSGKRDKSDERNPLFKDYLKAVRGLQPKIAVMENVRLLTSMKNEDGSLVLNNIYEEFAKSGYIVKHFEVNAKNFGVPQHRERVFFIAVRKNLNLLPTFPNETHGEFSDLFSTTEYYRIFADACSDLEFLESGEKCEKDIFHEAVKHPDHVINWLWNVPQGKSAHENEDVTLRPPSGYNTTYKRQIWNEPASTVQTTFGMISGCRNVHPIATRSLTIREALRIQSFPDSYKFVGSLGDIRATIGNAVPPLLAYQIAQHLAQIL